MIGAWSDRGKIAAIGVRMSSRVTSHGMSFNIDIDLDGFDLIVPCGIRGKGLCFMGRILARSLSLEEVAATLVPEFGRVFDRTMIQAPAAKEAFGAGTRSTET